MKDCYMDEEARGTANLIDYAGGKLITNVNVPDPGVGRRLSQCINRDADREGVTLYTRPESYPDGVSRAELRDAGFTACSGSPGTLVREPEGGSFCEHDWTVTGTRCGTCRVMVRRCSKCLIWECGY